VSLRESKDVTTSVAWLAHGGRFDLYSFAFRPSRQPFVGRGAWVWKTPVALTAGHAVVLTVDGADALRARLGFGPPARSFAAADSATRFESCPPDTPLFSGPGTVGPETGWSGSLITLDRRLCLRLRVVTGTASVAIRVPLGTRCPRG
jgi:hypothetical protein